MDLRPLKIEPGDDELRRLQKERFNAAMEEWRFLLARRDLDLDLPSTLEQMLAAHRNVSEADLELADGIQEELLLRKSC